MMGWIEQLLETARERRLDRLAAAYAVAAWLLVQAASIALPAFDAPAWALRWLIVAAVLGFALTLAAGWVLNKGRVGAPSSLKGSEAIFLAAIALVAVLTLGELAWHWSSIRPTGPTEDASAPPGSVAVLPFDNMSGDAQQRYFSEGISDELIGLLGRNPALRVAARTSSFFFEGKEQDIRGIGQKLNVRSILEGSVREQGGRVRIEAALVNARDGYQLWSQSYDRSLSDILALQADIAQSIAQALAPTLTGAPSKPRAPKPAQIDPDVYRDYLQAQFYFDQRLTEGQTPASQNALAQAVTLLRAVAARAPDFADGQAALANALSWSENDTELDGQIQQALTRALAIDPENPQALQVKIGNAGSRWDWNDVIDNAVRLKRTAAHTAIGARGLGKAYFDFNLLGPSLASLQEGARRDPFSASAWEGIANNLFAQGRYQDAIAAIDQALQLHPGDPVTLEYKCVSLAVLNRIDEAKDILSQLSQPGTPAPLTFHCKFFITLHSDGAKAAVALVDDGLTRDGRNLGTIGDVGFMLSHAGAFDQAMDWYEKAFSPHNWTFGFYPGATTPPAFFQNRRWIALTRRPDYQRWLAARARAIQVLSDGRS
jgi:adenylate cyclase